MHGLLDEYTRTSALHGFQNYETPRRKDLVGKWLDICYEEVGKWLNTSIQSWTRAQILLETVSFVTPHEYALPASAHSHYLCPSLRVIPPRSMRSPRPCFPAIPLAFLMMAPGLRCRIPIMTSVRGLYMIRIKQSPIVRYRTLP
jgi:hypothetical protein